MSDFLWGVATGAHQTEGNNLAADWWEFEHAPGTPIAEPSGDAVDAYHRWPGDMDLAAAAGFTDYRFGIEWSRIEPADGEVSLAAIEHYRRMIDGAVGRGLRPFITLHHFTLPGWFGRAGGWLSPDAAARFLRYVEAISPVLAGVAHVGTINEPNIVAMFAATAGSGMSALREGLPLPDPRVTDVLIDVHHAARTQLKDAHPTIAVGWGVSVQDCQAEPGSEDVLNLYTRPRDEVFLQASTGDDWVGVQTYTRIRISLVGGEPVELDDDTTRKTMNGWEFYPEALGGALRRTARIVGDVPIIVTENGIATTDDQERIEFTGRALQSMRAAIDDGVRVDGYLHWSLLDNYEWGSYAATFGLVAVDRATFERTPHPSLNWLGRQNPTVTHPDAPVHSSTTTTVLKET
ncbi:glycoside hydrolase family 1 protein [Mycolicibacterium hodleri]|uniref:Glycosyl hydrolase family protein n=1 Tax=Mycolicibacterium hodleri TaxID=49897 RepID=A0A502EF04_9MYCO|nr:family 1 glycosylhydrolase [Mycolicibacterium hodleri]TPG35060.1 glycosyl hydrolase family protein [Mycolicibacterium hodleri]